MFDVAGANDVSEHEQNIKDLFTRPVNTHVVFLLDKSR